jgi:hypothetical protein
MANQRPVFSNPDPRNPGATPRADTNEPPLGEKPSEDVPPAMPPSFAIGTTLPPAGGYEEGFPKVYFSVYEQRMPVIVKTPEQEAQIDRLRWMTVPPGPAIEPLAKFPKVYENINSPVKIVGTPEDEAEIGPGWREVRVPEHK